ncbi:MAG TPA: hypothetical protein GXZ92_05315 [Clostridiales bacterium]|nr:hypothetical protein [Clostridiales bacterium]
MIKKMICLGVILVMVILAFTACNSKDNETYGKPLPFNVAYSGTMYPVTETYLKEKVDSLQDLIYLSNENDYPFFNEIDENYNSDLSQKVREYDDSYFINKALILVFFYETSQSPTKIDSVRIKDNSINVIIARPGEMYTANDAETVYAFIIEVNKKDIESINEVDTKLINKGKVKDFN